MKSLKYAPLVLLSVFGLKALIFAPEWATVGALAVCAAIYLISEYVQYRGQLNEFEKKLKESDEKIKALEAKTGQLYDSVSAINISRGLRQVSSQVKI